MYTHGGLRFDWTPEGGMVVYVQFDATENSGVLRSVVFSPEQRNELLADLTSSLPNMTRTRAKRTKGAMGMLRQEEDVLEVVARATGEDSEEQ